MDSYPPHTTLDLQSLYSHLNKVSRSFAITIPFMEQPLREQVSLAYLLCRMIDTVEDDAVADVNERATWLSDFSFLAGDDFSDFAVLASLQKRSVELTAKGSAADDHALLHDMIPAISLLLTYEEEVRSVICHAVAILAHGMNCSLRRTCENEQYIRDLDDVDNYCYSVAGVVGEMLAELFCLYDTQIDYKTVMELSVSFGEGLQLTNILRDRCKDSARGVSFLPVNDSEGILNYVALTQGHLDDAIAFISMLPKKTSKGIRMFCLTNVAMAMFLLRQVSRRPLDPECAYTISHAQVKRLFILCKLASKSNFIMHCLARFLSFGMKRQRRDVRELRDKVSLWDHSSTTN